MDQARGIYGAKVLELGSRDGVALAASLLQGQGAHLHRINLAPDAPKRRIYDALPEADLQTSYDRHARDDILALVSHWSSADIILTSSDIDGLDLQFPPLRAGQILCDMTAICDGRVLVEDWQIQAQVGYVHITGWPDQPPQPIAVPICNTIGGFYAAIAVLAQCQHAMRHDPVRLDVSLLETSFVSLNAYLAGVFTGSGADPSRCGNGHTAVAPWNSYPCRDGQILICAGNQPQWQALCQLMGRADLLTAYPDQDARIAEKARIDAVIAAWSGQKTSQECEQALLTAGVAAGRILPLSPFPDCANLRLRGVVRADNGKVTAQIPAALQPLKDHNAAPKPLHSTPTRPLEGLKVVELGQFTTAPLCSRILGSMGAEVVKIEKSGGDEQRGWQGASHTIAETFWLNNTGKQSLCLDLATVAGKEAFLRHVASADVLVDNLKSGTLDKLGLGKEMLARANPALIHCAISGYGARSIYQRRPGFDMVIQGMSGFMAAVSPRGQAVKAGISAADILGGLAGAVAILGALSAARKGVIDLSMQDVAAWITAPAWGDGTGPAPLPAIMAAADGYIAVGAGAGCYADAAATRAALCLDLRRQGVTAEPVRRIAETAFCPQIKDAGLWALIPYADTALPVLGMPFRINAHRVIDLRPAPALPRESCTV